jgi:hypothetical protein
MQELVDSSPSWLLRAILALAGILTGGAAVRLYNTWLQHRKLPTNIEAEAAIAEKTRAEAGSIRARSASELTESYARMTVRLEEWQQRQDRLIMERDQARDDAKLADFQMRRMKAFLDLHGIKYSELDEH